MARFFNPQGTDGEKDARLHAPATARNRDAILDVLKPALPATGLIFEVASGSGEHAAYMAQQLPNHQWQPSDIEEHHLKSIEAWRLDAGASNILPAQHFDVMTDTFTDACFTDARFTDARFTDDCGPEGLAAVAAINLIHIAPWEVAETLIKKAMSALSAEGILFLYGPYKREGRYTSISNEQFDMSLRSRNNGWGLRDMEAVIEVAELAGFKTPSITPMPANNFSLIFTQKQSDKD
ncbi:MAG: DUF938 domain-containing protein [Kordiimonadaceae bacterium]|nr:DUF938 domain-containing protein [Kordiimonadaceae bacterium]